MIFFMNPHNPPGCELNPGICHEFACTEYLNSEEKRESYCKKKSKKAVVGE
jgi:hypothetical protein